MSHEPARWLATGTDPFFEATWAGGKPLEGGWYLLDIDAHVYAGRLHHACFYPDYKRGFVLEAERVPLRFAASSGTHLNARNLVVRMVSDASAIRFDPTVTPCEFSIASVTLRRIGRLEAAGRLLAGVFERAVGIRRRLGVTKRTVMDLLLGGPRRMADRLYNDYVAPQASDMSDYDVWLEFYDAMSEPRLARARSECTALREGPRISVVMPVYNTAERWLRRCIESVQAQVYDQWELCIADDASTHPHVRQVLQEYADADPRIHVVFRENNGHISEASNSALTLATGSYVALLDHDDELHPFALLECAKALQQNPGWRMMFTDEDKIDEDGRRSDPYFKSDWNPELFLSQNCVCHLGVYERALVEEVGGFRTGYEGAQDWDLTLRVSERLRPKQIGHVPKVLYHWRMIEGSTALAPSEKSYAHHAAMRAIQDHFDRTGTNAQVQEMAGYSGYYHIAHALPSPAPLVSLLIPTRDRVDLLKQCIDSIVDRTRYPNYEILVLDNGSKESETFRYFKDIQRDGVARVVEYPHAFNYSAINNFGARHARGTVLGLLNNDVEVISEDWLDEMVGHVMRPEIGMVGAMLYYPNNTIQHAGVILGIGGVAGHCYVGNHRGYPGDKHRAGLAQSLSVVTAACAVVRAEVFEQVGGLDEDLKVAFNDVDLCLRIREAGYRNVWTPFAELYHYESASRGYENTPEKRTRFRAEESFMKDRWGELLEQDPYYSPNFTLSGPPFTLAYPPRATS
ncbi:glycosyltransferase family 2 protein [Lysobacter sp. A421]